MDRLLRGISEELDLRIVTAVTTETVREGCRRHELRGAEAVILGRLLTAGTLMATLTKREDERVRIELRGNGPVGRALVDARSDGGVRGCMITRLPAPARPGRAKGRPEVGDLVGRRGQLVVTRDVGLEQPYQGVVELATGELDVDLQRYLDDSEQLPSALHCEIVLDNDMQVVRAAGVLCQTFPGGDSQRIEQTRRQLEHAGLFDVLRRERTAEELMGVALLGDSYTTMGDTPLSFRCDCGRNRALAVVSTLGADDIEKLADEQDGTEVRCSYCGEVYELDGADLRDLARRIRAHAS